jgi:hypothetical protein
VLFRSALLSIAILGAFAVLLRVTVVPPESCGLTSEQSIERASRLAVGWMVSNQKPDGRYVYLYHPSTDSTPPSYNEVRHAGVTMSLYQAAGRLQNGEALAAADDALQWMIRNLERRDGWAALAPGREAKLGASALMLVGLAERRLATGDTSHDELMLDLAAFLTAMQRADGGFYVGYNLAADEPDREGTSRYYPGEALWALALTHEALPDAGLEEPARRALDFVTLKRDEVEEVRNPPLADQWAAYGLSEVAEWGLRDEHIAYARDLAERFGFLIRMDSQREGSFYGRLLRGGDVRASGVGTWAEGLSGLWRVSASDERLSDIRGAARERLQCVAGNLAARQLTPEDATSYPRPILVEGAWIANDETRMDDQQHAFSGLLYALDAIRDRPDREPESFLDAASDE